MAARGASGRLLLLLLGAALLAPATAPSRADQLAGAGAASSAQAPPDVKPGAPAPPLATQPVQSTPPTQVAPSSQPLPCALPPAPGDAVPGTLASATLDPRQGSNSVAVIELDPETLWRPRGSEVRFTIGGQGLTVQAVRVCFAWSQGAQPMPAHRLAQSPLVRSITDAAGKIEYGAAVPALDEVGGPWWPFRARGRSAYQFTALYIVPLADMQVVATLVLPDGKTTQQVAVILQVGVTSVAWAASLVLVTLASVCAFLYWTKVDLVPSVKDPVLRVLTGKDRFASLSQFQIMLWTFVVGGAAVYVMALSGNLIGISNGTLVLLGIAGVTTILARTTGGAPEKKAPDAAEGAGPSAAAAPEPGPPVVEPAQAAPAVAVPIVVPVVAGVAPQARQPQWSDLMVTDYDQGIDVTRIQMLIFTVISAAFVAIKVTVSYEIPEIPDNYLLLMGISNGLYVAGRRVKEGTNTVKSGGT